MSFLLFIGAAFGFAGVALGAFGAHALAKRIADDRMRIYHTGIQYHLIHALAIIGVGMLASQVGRGSLLALAGYSFAVGILLFSGSLYGLAGQWIRGKWGLLTPVGGVFFLLGWVLLAIAVWP